MYSLILYNQIIGNKMLLRELTCNISWSSEKLSISLIQTREVLLKLMNLLRHLEKSWERIWHKSSWINCSWRLMLIQMDQSNGMSSWIICSLRTIHFLPWNRNILSTSRQTSQIQLRQRPNCVMLIWLHPFLSFFQKILVLPLNNSRERWNSLHHQEMVPSKFGKLITFNGRRPLKSLTVSGSLAHNIWHSQNVS